MKITDVRTIVVGNRWKNWIFVIVDTSDGIQGIGEATGGLLTQPNVADVAELRDAVVGEDPLQPTRLWAKLFKKRFLTDSQAINAIELACWDILGKYLGEPVWRLLGGKHNDTLRVYANGWYQGPRDPSFFSQRALELVERGYTALKFDPFGDGYLHLSRDEEAISIAIVKAMRESVGDRVDLLIEAHDRFSPAYAVRIATILKAFDPLWIETPVYSEDVAATVDVARTIPMPVAAGERYHRLDQFTELLRDSVVSIVQPEVLHLGLWRTIKACGIAEAHNAMIACHQAQSPYCTAVNCHIHAAIPNFLIQENFDDTLDEWTWAVVKGVPRVDKGYLQPANTPGFGVELDLTEAAKHPYGEHNFLRLFEPGWEKRQ
jgi:galactonate dehydratase